VNLDHEDMVGGIDRNDEWLHCGLRAGKCGDE
jgi:hypothetical protein